MADKLENEWIEDGQPTKVATFEILAEGALRLLQVSHGYAVVDDADYIKCNWGKCDKSKCCAKVCSSYDCPKYYELVDDANDVVCKANKCTKDQCCEKGEACFEYIRYRFDNTKHVP